MLQQTITAAVPVNAPAGTRSFTITDNSALDWHVRTRAGLPFELRCQGQGVCTIGGNASHYRTRAAADRAGRIWVITGTAPADQRAPGAGLVAALDADREEILAATIRAFREEMAPHYQAYRDALAGAGREGRA